MAGGSALSEPSELFNLQRRKSDFERERSKRHQNIPTIYRVDPFLKDLNKEQFDRNIIPLGLFDRRTRDCFAFDGATERMRIQLKIDVVITFFEDTNNHLKDWMEVSKEVVRDPTAMKNLYDEHRLHSLENEVVQSALALDAIFVTCFLSLAHVRYSSPHSNGITSLQRLPWLKYLDVAASKFLSKTLQNTQELLSRESDSSVLRILQDILKLENQIPLSVIRNVIEIMFRFRPADEVIVMGVHIEANDVLRAICRSFVRTYKRIFPCLQLSETGEAEAPTDRTSVDQKPIVGVSTRATNTTPPETHLATTQTEIHATDAPFSTTAAVTGEGGLEKTFVSPFMVVSEIALAGAPTDTALMDQKPFYGAETQSGNRSPTETHPTPNQADIQAADAASNSATDEGSIDKHFQFPSLPSSKTGLAGFPTDGASIDQKPTHGVWTPGANTSWTETHHATTQAEIQATDAASTTDTGIDTAVINILEIDAAATDEGWLGTAMQIKRTHSDAASTETPLSVSSTWSVTPTYGAWKIRASGNTHDQTSTDPKTGQGHELQVHSGDIPPTTKESRTTQVGTDIIHSHHLLHCLAQVIWSKGIDEAAESQPNSPPERRVKSCSQGSFQILRRAFQICTGWSRREYHYPLKQRIPTAKELWKRGIRFEGQDGLFPRFEPHYLWWWSATFYLPRLINIEDRTEACWRNLLAFEDAYYNFHHEPENKSFTSYLFWMDELVSTEEDVAVLMERENPVILWNSTGDCKAIVTLIKSVIKEHVPVEHKKWRETRAKISRFHNHTTLRMIGAYLTPYFSKPWLLCSVTAAFILLGLATIQTGYTITSAYGNKS